jgi:hypothetical protein
MAIQLESVVNITLSVILIGLVLYIVFKPEDDDDQVKFDAAANFNQKQYDLLKEQLSIQEKLVDAQIAEMQKEPPVIEEHDDADEMNVTQYCGSGGVKGLGDIGVTGIEPTDIGLTDLRPSENLPQDIPARILNATFDSENSLVVSFTAAVSGDSNPIGTYLVMVEGKSWRISNTMSPYVIPESKLKMQGVPEGLITVKMFGETTRGHQIHPTNEDAKSVYYTERPRAVITPVVPNATAPNATPPNTTVPNASPPPPVSTSVNPPSNVSVVTYASGTMTISFTPPPTNALETFTNSTDYYLVTVENKGVSYKFSTAAQNDSITFDDNNTIEIQMRGNDMNGTGYAFPELEQLSVSMQFASGDKMSPPSQKVPVISKGYEIVATATTPGSVTGPFTLTAYEEGYLIVEFTTPMSFGGDFSHYIVNIGANGQTFKFSTKADTDGNAGFKIPDSSQTVNYQTLSGGRGKIGITAVGTDMDGKAYNFAAGTKLWISVSTVNATGAESGAVSVNGGVQLLSKGDGETPIDAWTINDIVDAEGHRSIDIPEHLSIAKKQPWIFINDIPEGVKIHLNVKNMTTGKETEPFYVVNTPGYSCYYAANGNPVCGMSGGTTYVPGWIKGSGKPNIKNANIQDHAEHGRFLTLLYDANATDRYRITYAVGEPLTNTPAPCTGTYDSCSAPCGPGTKKWIQWTGPSGCTDHPEYQGTSTSCNEGACSSGSGSTTVAVGEPEPTPEPAPAPEPTPAPAPAPAPTPVDCVGSWGQWGQCSKQCGGGTFTRTYNVTTPASGGGRQCSVANGKQQSQSCNTQACVANVDCVGTWVDGPCSKTCGGGTKTVTFNVSQPATGSGVCPHANGYSTTANCNVHECAATETVYTSKPDYPVITNAFLNITDGTLDTVLNPVARAARYYISVQNGSNSTGKTLVTPKMFNNGTQRSILVTQSWLRSASIDVGAGIFIAIWVENNVGERYSVYKRDIDFSMKGEHNDFVGLSSRSA